MCLWVIGLPITHNRRDSQYSLPPTPCHHLCYTRLIFDSKMKAALIIIGFIIFLILIWWFTIERPERNFNAKVESCTRASMEMARKTGANAKELFDGCMLFYGK